MTAKKKKKTTSDSTKYIVIADGEVIPFHSDPSYFSNDEGIVELNRAQAISLLNELMGEDGSFKEDPENVRVYKVTALKVEVTKSKVQIKLEA